MKVIQIIPLLAINFAVVSYYTWLQNPDKFDWSISGVGIGIFFSILTTISILHIFKK